MTENQTLFCLPRMTFSKLGAIYQCLLQEFYASTSRVQPFAKYVPPHIPHAYHSQMSDASQTWFLDVLLKNEAKHSDMLDIMATMRKYLGDDFPSTAKVLSGGDQLTCERQNGAQRHVMDGDTPDERLQQFEPVCEDWHALMCFLKVS